MDQSSLLKINPSPESAYEFAEEFLPDLFHGLHDKCAIYYRYVLPTEPETGGGIPTEVLIGFLSGSTLSAALTALYQIICRYLERHAARELTLERGNAKITIKGHSIPDERALVREFFPEAFIDTGS